MSIPQSVLDRLGTKAPQRLALERMLLKRAAAHRRGDFHFKRYLSINILAHLGLRLCGLTKQGVRNILDIQIVENRVVLPSLPRDFEGFRLLQLTDLHCDIHPLLMPTIAVKMQEVHHDAVVLVGDYHNEVIEPFENSLHAMRHFIPYLHPVRFATLGNHDFLAKVAVFEECGLPVLLNENRALERNGERLWFCGVDDGHFYRTHDLEAARTGIPKEEVSILLSHTPETFREAASLGYSLHLSGHTHGGQICLPGGIPLLSNTHGCGSEHIAGPWREGSMLGYTSRGTGSAGVPARFNCPPEMTLHILTRGDSEG